MKLVLDVVDLGYQAHGENARASLLALQSDRMMQRRAYAEERDATAVRDASDYATTVDARMDDAAEMADLAAGCDTATAEARQLRNDYLTRRKARGGRWTARIRPKPASLGSQSPSTTRHAGRERGSGRPTHVPVGVDRPPCARQQPDDGRCRCHVGPCL